MGLRIKTGEWYSFYEETGWGDAVKFDGFTKTYCSWATFIKDDGSQFVMGAEHFESLGRFRLVMNLGK